MRNTEEKECLHDNSDLWFKWSHLHRRRSNRALLDPVPSVSNTNRPDCCVNNYLDSVISLMFTTKFMFTDKLMGFWQYELCFPILK